MQTWQMTINLGDFATIVEFYALSEAEARKHAEEFNAVVTLVRIA